MTRPRDLRRRTLLRFALDYRFRLWLETTDSETGREKVLPIHEAIALMDEVNRTSLRNTLAAVCMMLVPKYGWVSSCV